MSKGPLSPSLPTHLTTNVKNPQDLSPPQNPTCYPSPDMSATEKLFFSQRAEQLGSRERERGRRLFFPREIEAEAAIAAAARK